MQKLLLGLTLLFALEARAGDPGGLDDDTKDFLTGISLIPVIIFGVVVIGGVIWIADEVNEKSSFDYYDKNYMFHYDPSANAIIFSDDSSLKNFEIHFSNENNYNFHREEYLTNDFFKPDELYVGFKYRFWIWWPRAIYIYFLNTSANGTLM